MQWTTSKTETPFFAAIPRPPTHPPTPLKPSDPQTTTLEALAKLRGRYPGPVQFPGKDVYRKWAGNVLGFPLHERGGGEKDRKNSYPFVSGDAFREMSEYVCDETSCEHDPPRHSRVCFVKTEKLDYFIANVLPVFEKRHTKATPNRIVLITHNSDYTSPYSAENVRGKHGLSRDYPIQRARILENPVIARWFAQNPSLLHDKLTPIPIGLENRYNAYGKHVATYLSLHDETRKAERTKLLIANFNPKTNPSVRGAALARVDALMAEGHDRVLTSNVQTKKKGAKKVAKDVVLTEYGTKVAEHKYCLAPPGHGLDTHRLWESFVFGCIPVVLDSPMKPLLEGLPVVTLKSWEELSIDSLTHHYKRLNTSHTTLLAKMYLPYWVELIADSLHGGDLADESWINLHDGSN